MIVSNKLEGATSDLVAVSELKSPYFLSTEHPVECFSFYFIFGIDEVADDLTVLIRKKDNNDEKIVWQLQSSWKEKPDQWLEGRVEVGHEWEEEHEYRVSYSYRCRLQVTGYSLQFTFHSS